MRTIAIIGAASILCGCVATTGAGPKTGHWQIAQGRDPIHGSPAGAAQLITRSRNAHYAVKRPALLLVASIRLECFDRARIVRMHFNHRVGSNRSAKLEYRVDDKPGRDLSTRFMQDYQTVVIEDEADVARFAADLRTSSKLYVQVSSHIVGVSSAEFTVDGEAAAIDAAYAGCPLNTKAAQQGGVPRMSATTKSVSS